MNGIRHARLIRFLLIYLIYGRVFILSLFPVLGIIFAFKLSPIYIAYWFFLLRRGFSSAGRSMVRSVVHSEVSPLRQTYCHCPFARPAS